MNRTWTQPILIVSLIVLVLHISPFHEKITEASPQNPTEVAGMLQQTYDKAAGLTADFNQETFIKMNQRKRSGAGTVIFLKPMHMRWDYLSPDRQILISDGETISMYFETAQQMIITSAKDYLQSDVTHSFFSGTGDILRDFDVLAPDSYTDKDEGAYLIKLIPKSPHPHVDHLYIWATQDTFLIKRIQVIDHFNTITDIFFNNIQILNKDEDNTPQKINTDVFTFTPPPGTEIIRQ